MRGGDYPRDPLGRYREAMSVVFSILPFLLLIGFWLFLMRNYQSRQPSSDPVVERLDSILQELERIRRELAQRNSASF
jgi:ATP-dependent Zn protease